MVAEEKDTTMNEQPTATPADANANAPTPEHERMEEGEEAPPRGAKAMAAVRWLLVVGAAVLAAFMWLSYARTELSSGQPAAAAAKVRYQCPMHPQIVSDLPGECPICHMSLEPIAAARNAADDAPEAGAAPASASGGVAPAGATPGAAAPLGARHDHDHGDAGGSMLPPGSIPPGTTPVKLALDRVQSIGVRTAVAEDRALASTLRVTAVVTPPEQGASEVHVRTPGFVEAILVDQTGVAVRAGQPMLSVYSPEILQAQNELLATSQWMGDAGASSASSARRKLELLGMSPADIERVLVKREPLRAIPIAAPRGGFVTKKGVVLGSYVTPETVLYEVQDLSSVYVMADVLAADVGSVAVGAEGKFIPSGHPERAMTAKVDLVYPLVNAEARTRRIRMRLRNDATKAYLPGEYGTVELTLASRRGVAIPRDAIIETGTASYVFVVAGEGRFTPRVVVTAGSDEERVTIVAGLAAGERVVSGATFLVDSESRLQASIAEATNSTPAPVPPTAAPPTAAAPPAAPHTGHQ